MKIKQDASRRQRRQHERGFKEELVRLSLQPGASVSAIALDNGINANMLFKWRREHPQLELVGGQVVLTEPPETAGTGKVASLDEQRRKHAWRPRPNLRELPAHLPRRTVMHWPAGHNAGCACAACGLALREIGQDISEVLDYEPGSFHVVRHVRPKLACGGCKTIAQANAPSRPCGSSIPWTARVSTPRRT